MTSARPIARQSASALARPAPAPAIDLEALLRRFPQTARPKLCELSCADPRFVDLMRVFPAVALVISAARDDRGLASSAFGMVSEGAGLRKIAEHLRVPYWTRRLPPEAFSAEMPELPASEEFTRRISNVLPRSVRTSGFWLDSVVFALASADEDFAVWLAGQPVLDLRGSAPALFTVLAAYAWFSRAPACRAGRLILVPWHPDMAFDAALCSARAWLNRIRLVVQLGNSGVTDPWLPAGRAGDVTIRPLLCARDLLIEASEMRNCADQFVDRIVRDRSRLFSVRRRGLRIATLEIGYHAREAGVLDIAQLKGRGNVPASRDAWQAAHLWLAGQSGLLKTPTLAIPDIPFDQRTWAALMRPYRKEKATSDWLPHTLNSSEFNRLAASMADLARRAQVSSWLFN